MTIRMLIDAAHSEEIRVVVANENIIEEIDFETSTKKQIKGNIYLAKVMRVEPSLQAAFVDYGEERHGFLAFHEIHPDYFQIPVSDRETLLKAERKLAEGSNSSELEDQNSGKNQNLTAESTHYNEEADETSFNSVNEATQQPDEKEFNLRELEKRRSSLYSKYRIQEVIKKRQIILVQVSKEERGNKGAAMTSFLSLAGRYCVLMPKTAHSGGISRKVPTSSRKKLREIYNQLAIPDGMSAILRTAGAERTKTEIRRDFTYLLKLWEQVRNTTLKSVAPSLVHAENDIIKRAIRDLFQADIEEILIDGEDAYKTGKAFMKMLIPSKSKLVKKYSNANPLFQKYLIDEQLEKIHQPESQLRSGGYIVINPTEALVAIDVNSGKSTRERNIEETALKTNLEAASEIARQMRLRDLAGLIVIDFIDMNEHRNNRIVERRLRDAFKNDRARIHIGRISSFGLLEMSRQRLRPSLMETSYIICSHCEGLGRIRSIESLGIILLKSVRDQALNNVGEYLEISISPNISNYILNNKRNELTKIEQEHSVNINISNNNFMQDSDFLIKINNTNTSASQNENINTNSKNKTYKNQSKDNSNVSNDNTSNDFTNQKEQDENLEELNRRKKRGRRGGRNRRRNKMSEELYSKEKSEHTAETKSKNNSLLNRKTNIRKTKNGIENSSLEENISNKSKRSSQNELKKPLKDTSKNLQKKENPKGTSLKRIKKTIGESSEFQKQNKEETGKTIRTQNSETKKTVKKLPKKSNVSSKSFKDNTTNKDSMKEEKKEVKTKKTVSKRTGWWQRN